jgi:hypothetical protein
LSFLFGNFCFTLQTSSLQPSLKACLRYDYDFIHRYLNFLSAALPSLLINTKDQFNTKRYTNKLYTIVQKTNGFPREHRTWIIIGFAESINVPLSHFPSTPIFNPIPSSLEVCSHQAHGKTLVFKRVASERIPSYLSTRVRYPCSKQT